MSQIKLTADSGGGTTSLKAPSSTTSNADVVLKLPVADGNSGEILKTDGSGQLSFGSNAGTTINNNADNRVITGSGTASTLNGESTLTYDGSGNVGITNSSGSVAVTVTTANNTDGGIYFTDGSGGNKGALSYLHTNDSMNFRANGTTKMTIDSSGNVGVGTSSPGANLHVHTDANGEGILVKSTGNTSNALTFDANRGTGGVIGVAYGRWNGTTVAQMSFVSGDDGTDKNDGFITFGTESAASNGNVNATERLRIQSGGGISFNGDTAAANALDDYEIGTFTPVVNLGVTSPTYDIQRGGYILIGKMLHFQYSIRINGGTPDSNHLRFGGLPFSSFNGTAYTTAGANLGYQEGDFTDQQVFHIAQNASDIRVYNKTGSVSAGNSHTLINKFINFYGAYIINH